MFGSIESVKWKKNIGSFDFVLIDLYALLTDYGSHDLNYPPNKISDSRLSEKETQELLERTPTIYQ